MTLLHVPIFMFASRDQIYTTFKLKRTKFNHVFFSVIITYMAFLIPLLKPDVISVLGFFGGVFATTTCLVFPVLIGIRIYHERTYLNLGLKIIFCLLVFVVLSSAYATVFPGIIPNASKDQRS